MAINLTKNDIPAGWQLCRLPDFACIVMGQSPSSETYNHEGNGIPFFQGKAEFGEVYPRIDKYCSRPNKIANAGATLLSVRAPVGPTNLAKIDCCIGRGLAAIHSLGGIEPKFILYLFRSIEPTISGRGTGSTFNAINKTFVEELKFALPPLNQQARIVAKIDELFSELDKGVESLKAAREQLKVYRQAVLKHAFEGKLTEQWREENKHKLETPEQLLVHIDKERDRRCQQQLEEWNVAVNIWELEGKKGKKPRRPSLPKQLKVITSNETEALPEIPYAWRFVRLSEIAEIGSGMSVNLSRKINEPVKVAYLRVANVQRGFIDLSEVKFMTIEKSQLDGLALKHWDVLFNEGGDRDKLGRGWIWESKITPCITQNHVFRASPYLPSKEQSTLISHWGNTFGQRYFEEMGKQTTNLASINKTVLSDFPVPLMSFDEQEELCKQIDHMMTFIDVQLDEISAGLEKARTLRQAILQSAFSGGLTQQDPNDEPASVLLERIRAEKAMQEGTRKKDNRKKIRKATA